MTEHFQVPIWLRLLPLTLGIAYAIYTTLPVLNPGPEFWFSDEGGISRGGPHPFQSGYSLRPVRSSRQILSSFFTDHPFSIVFAA